MGNHMKFRVMSGTHYEGGKRYTKGQVVSSLEDLVKLFVNKFEKVAEATEASVGSSSPPPPPSAKKPAKKAVPKNEEDDE